ncbi:hypothetical protein PISMIDRAFT_13269 [Pisolithus microcarpus 441]|uniref:Unplaced genomic scaffold scaffold_89, whole genome shotgun sequence n=1 Tax=Pisolithus microcarpus 441 TaxID=765257 RepID=A0A0C9Y5N8_9AGAM|nr:hypothetical protein PISMIDRAFT_13269 [Pisolithus microcarpus 441]
MSASADFVLPARPLSRTLQGLFSIIFRSHSNIQSESPDSDLEQLLTIDPPSPTPLESSLALAETVASSLHTHDDDRLSTYSVGETLCDPEGYGLDILPASEYAWHFVIARDWWLLAVDCVMGICHQILTSKIDLDSLVESNFKVNGRTIISVVYNALFYHRKSQCNPTWQPMEVSNLIMAPGQLMFWSSIDDLVFRRLFFEELENVALPYLMHVWHTADSFVYQYYSPYRSPPHPSTLTTMLSPHALLSVDDIHYITYLMTFQLTISYLLFHQVNQREGMMYWFVNESMHSILYYTLVKPDTATWIGVLEIVANANLNVTISPVIGFVVEKFSFVLAWVIVEIQDLLLEQYSLCHTTLGQDHVRRVAELER